MGSGMTQAQRNEQHDELEAFFAYIEDPDSDLTVVLAIEEAYGVSV